MVGALIFSFAFSQYCKSLSCAVLAPSPSFINTAKSKCLFFRSRNMRRCSFSPGVPFVVGGKDIEFVNKWSHLGHIINERLDDDDDVFNRKNVMIGQINNLLCCFSNTDSFTKNRLFQSYCCSHYMDARYGT